MYAVRICFRCVMPLSLEILTHHIHYETLAANQELTVLSCNGEIRGEEIKQLCLNTKPKLSWAVILFWSSYKRPRRNWWLKISLLHWHSAVISYLLIPSYELNVGHHRVTRRVSCGHYIEYEMLLLCARPFWNHFEHYLWGKHEEKWNIAAYYGLQLDCKSNRYVSHVLEFNLSSCNNQTKDFTHFTRLGCYSNRFHIAVWNEVNVSQMSDKVGFISELSVREQVYLQWPCAQLQ